MEEAMEGAKKHILKSLKLRKSSSRRALELEQEQRQAEQQRLEAAYQCIMQEDGANAVGPHLFAVVDRDIASVAGFGYSGALSNAEGAWTVENLSAFLESPKGFAPGTTMGFSGLKKLKDRANVIAYLQSVAN